MIAAEQIIDEALAHDVVLYLKEGRLAYTASNKSLPDSLKRKIDEHKESVIEYLQKLDRAQKAQELRAPMILPRSVHERPPISFAQQRLWFLAQLEGVSATYHLPAALHLRGALDRRALCRALNTVLARHEGLRSVFVAVDGEPQVRLLPETTGLPLIEHDLRGHENASVELARLSKEEARAPFDLAQGPLIRSRLVQLADDDHVLLLTQHHIVSDGWSIGVLSRELTTLYQAFQQGQANPLPPLTIQYPDYAAWQRGWLSGERLERQTAYWREALTGAPALLELPTDRPRPAQPDHSGARVPIVLDAELTRSLKQLSQRHGTTLFMTVLAAWAVVLSRLSGQDEVVIGTPTANRGRVETEGLIGFFVNTLALRIQLDESPSVSELLSRARKTALAAQEHQDLSFEQVVEIVQPPRRLNQNPIFQVLFNWDEDRTSLPSSGSVAVAPMAMPYEVSRFDLKLNLTERDGSLQGIFLYAPALFDAATIERQVGYLQAVLRAMAADSEQSVAAIELLSEDERRLQLETWNATAAEYPQDRCIHELFEEQARNSPEAPAVVHEDRVLSYGELNAQANRLAHYLMGQGVGPDDRVAICVERSAALVIGLLAILKAGAAYVPLDPAYPSGRLSQIVGDSAPSLLLIDAAGRAALGEAPCEACMVVDLEPLRQGEASATAWSSQPVENPQVAGLTARHLAYVIYTSGSTGTPKGVMVEHHSLVNFHEAVKRDIYRSGARLRIGWNASFSFDMSMKGFLQLLIGHALVIIPQDVRATSAGFLRFLDEQAIDGFDITPSLLKALIGEGLLEEQHRRTVLVGGEPIDAVLWQQLQSCRTIEFHNMYGPTECTVDATMSVIGSDDAIAHIGRPIANTRIYLLDEQRQPALLGATGELYIGGDGVARGYFNRPELTAERFLKDPFSPHPEARMYRTGDLARYLPDGNIEYLGRNDFQVKIRGFRIELGEIEARLSQHALVREAVVEARDAGEEKRLAAYVIPAEETIETDELVAALRAYLATTLPDYMVPSAFVRMAAWPLTPNGKLDRKALPAPDDEAYARREYEAPQGEIEQTLAGLWRELLRVERIGRQDDFFELGGHSLLAVRLLVHIRQSLGADLPVVALFAQPTLAGLAQAVIEAGAGRAKEAVLPMARISRDEPMPLSFAQQRLWFLAQLEGGGATYHVPVALSLQGGLDTPALRGALGALFTRHEALRSVFVAVDGQPHVELLSAQKPFHLVEHDLEDHPDPSEELARLGREEALSPFDLTHGPLFRGRLVRLAEFDHVLLLTLHHIVSDGWSVGILVREFNALYGAFAQGQPDPLPPLTIQYPDYAAWQRGWLSGERLERQTAYWREALTGAPALLELPTDRPRPTSPSFEGAMVPIHVDAGLTRALKNLSQQHDATLFMTLMTAWAAVLSCLSGQNDLVIGTLTANRRQHEIEPLVGFFVNTLALRIDLSGDPSFAALLERVRTVALAAQDYQDLPFEQVVEIVQPPRRLDHTPIFQVLFSWRNNDQGTFKLPNLQVELMRSPFERIDFDLKLILTEIDETIRGTLTYATNLFDATTVERQAGYLVAVLKAMAAQADQPIARIDLLTREERRLQLETWNATAAEYPQDRCIHELFEEQVRKSPEARAVVHEDRVLSYSELNAQANRLAHYLIGLGVGPDDRVAICVERSAAMVIGLLAILKAGGAYVPLDPAYPSERLSQIVGDAAPSLLLIDAAGRAALGGAASSGWTLVDLEPLRQGEGSATAWSSQPAENAQVPGLTSRHLAYVIYTSGSTGTPKGVMNEHRALINRLLWMQQAYGLDSTDVVLQKTTFSFDVSVWEFFWTLQQGATLLVPAPELHKDPAGLIELMVRAGVTTAHFVPSMLDIFLMTRGVERCTALRRLICSGEALPAAYVQACREKLPGAQLHNLYGPTEAAVDVTAWTCPPSFAGGVVPIGRPIANTRIYLLDEQGQPALLGATGELYIGGDGIARGYFNRPELTAERFLKDPFSPHPEARMYRTGDLARYLPDGNIEYLGRNDFQVKIRGFRIELGEIEARLAEHSDVRNAAVVALGEGTDKRLVAYVVLKHHTALERNEYREARQVDEWQEVFESAYSQALKVPLGEDFNVWKSTYTGQPIPLEEMQEWCRTTVERIAALRPRRLLEIGVGSGLLLARLAGDCEAYWATDFSQATIDMLRSQLAEHTHLATKVHLRAQGADVVDGLPSSYFDAVVINSVVQYFPNVGYLIDVIQKALNLLAPGGSLFLGDIRNLELIHELTSAVQLRQANAGADTASIRRRIEQNVLAEKELLLAPSFFASLPQHLSGISAVEIQIKRGHTANELSRYRYDVVLRRGPAKTISLASVPAQRWDDVVSLNELNHDLKQARPVFWRVTNIPNARLAGEVEAWRALCADEDLAVVHGLLENPPNIGVEPEALYGLGESLGYRVLMTWSAACPANFDAIFINLEQAPVDVTWTDFYASHATPAKDLTAFANNPSHFHQLASLRRHVAQSLPDYMVPAAFVTLDELPLTPSGKLDRRGLPAPDDDAVARSAYEPPQGEIEAALASLWQGLLGLERVGRRDHFFELGGHSLLAVRLRSRIGPTFGVELPLPEFFAHPTVSELAAVIVQHQADDTARLAPIAPTPRDGVLPISFAQQRLWFLAQLEGVSATYHLPAALHLRGALDRRALCRALDTVLARHEGLRSVFVAVDGEPQVRLLPETTGLPLIEHDLRGHENASVELARLGKEEARAPFDLAQGPLIRSRLVQLADDDHVLLLTQHHIVSDGWSIGVLSRELTTLYQAFQQGQANPLPPLTIQYPDYAAWQRGWLSGERLERQTAYWREALTGAPALLELPTDRPRPAQPDHSGARVPIVLDAELTRSLKQLSQRHGTTLFMTVLAAWAVVLSRLSGQDEVVIGTPTANRGRVETEGLIGFFVNTLALRIQLDESPSVSELLSRARKTALAAQEHQDLSFEQVVEIVQPPRRLNQNPIFQVLFNWDEDRTSLPSSGSVAVAPMAMPYEVSRFDLKLNLTERDGSLQGIFLYAPALFDAATIERQVGYLQAVLRAMAADSEQSVAAIELLSEDERRLQLETWNATAAEYPQDRCIHELFEEQARNSPEAPAVVHEDRVLSYGELNAQANRLAHYLMGQGVGPDDRVAICVERSAALVIGLLAILKAGAAYVPLDPAYPSGRLSQIVGDSAPSLLLIDAAGRAALGEAPCEACMVVDLEPLRQGEASATAWSSQPVENPQVAGLTARHLAYVIYTSGSTGTPKGVMVEHHSLVNFHEAVKRDIYRSGARLRIGWNASFSFDMSMKGFLQLLIGHALVIIPQDVRATSAGFLRFLDEQAIDGFDITPSLLKALIGEGLLEEQHRRTVLVGGEPIDAVLWQQLQSCRTIEFHNMYGPTECTVDATMSVIGSDDAIAHIGRPIANTRIYLLDEQRQPALLGATGELYIGGDGVARGYFNRPELTAERFLKDPFSPHPEARMYRTGDLARYLADGNIEYLGRNDFQVKIRGFRIELGEIEARLSQHALVREAVVEARDAGEEKRLAAYVIPAEETIETDELVAALRAYLATTLPDYMVPSAFVRMAAWPLTPNGKLDRKALPAPDDEAYARREYEAPQGEIEQTLAGLWRELLRVERIGRQDDFFELGGHSLLAVRLLVHIRQSLGADLPVVALFAQPTLAGLAQAVIEAGAGRAKEAVLPMARISRDEPMPLSFAQQRLWFLAQLEGVSATYHIPLALRLRGALDRAALCRALDTVLARHEGLRSVFVAVDGEPQVRLLPETTGLPLIEHDLRGHENASVELARLGKEEARAPFDLAQGPLIRSRLVQLADDDHVLLLTQHHIVSDGWSIGVLSRELTTLYQAFQQGQANPLPPLTIQYPDYAAWQRGWLSGERLERQTAYWREALTGAPALLELPTDRPRPAQPDHSGARVPIVLDAELTRSLKQLSQRHGTTLFMTVLAAWAVVLSRLSGQDEVVIGTPTANRGRVETEGLIGFFVNTLALRIQLDESPSVSELLSRARKFALAAQEHQDLPFEQVVEIVQPPRRLDQNPIFQVLFNWRNNEVSLPEFAGVQVTLPVTGYEVLKFDLELSLSELNEQIVGSLAYATALFDATTIERHVGYLQAALRAMVSNSEQRVAAIELLSEEERRLQLETWNATAAEYPQDRCIHELFEEQVRKSPEARAVVHEDRVLSYSELNAQANRLAHYLIGLGVGPDDRVAICVERSAAMVIGLLAILKAGGAYVPLDPAYPSERLSQIVGDAAPSLLLIDAAGRAALGGAASSGWTLVDLEPLRQGEGSATAWSSQPAENAQVPGLTSRHLAYVIYTSGSTGTPKGVMNEHRALINRLLWMQQAYGLDSTDVVLQKTTFSFDVSVWEFFWTLQQGATLLVPAPELHKDPAGLIELMVRAGVTTAHFVPSMLDIFLMTRGVERCTALRRLICSGEALPAAYVQACREKLPGAQLHNLYGPTEAAVDVTAWTCPPSFAGGVVPIGRPIANTRIYLLDEQGQPALLGATGELYIGGDGIARGYFNRPELTAERFLKDPFSPHPEARMYRTGDLARYLPDGNIEYLGRNDFQVKIRGFRIELGEIEAQLSQHALVREAVVEARDAGEEKRLAAYVIPAEETIETDELVAALRAYLATTLPDYMVPSAFVRMAAWPLTPNGKLDRKALPAPDDEAYVRREYEAPQGEIEQTLAGLWRELLQIERIGRQDDFFELGGHSLTATRLLARIRQALGVELPVATVFARPTLMTLAQAVAEASATAQAVLPMARISREEPMPLSFAQQRLWFLAQLEGASQAYHMAYGIRLKGELKREALQQALGRLVARHEALRTTFVVVEGEPRQKITAVEESRFELLEQDLRQLGEEEREQRLAGLIQEEAQRRFDLEHGPLIRGRLIRLAEQEHGLLITMHHIVSDGWSMEVMMSEMSILYAAYGEGQGDPLPALEVQYGDYALWQREWMAGELMVEQAEYWKQTLGGAPEALELPTDHRRPEQQDYAGGMVEMELDEELTAAVKELSRRQGTTVYMTLLGSWAALLGRLSGQKEVVIGSPVANRGRVELEGLIGFLANTVATRVDLGGRPTVKQLLGRVKGQVLGAQANQDMPFEQVVEVVNPERSMSRQPLFQVMLAWQNTERARAEFAGLDVEPLPMAEHRVSKFDLTLYLREVGEKIVGKLEYATGLWERNTVERYGEYWRRLVAGMVAEEAAVVDSLAILSEEELEHAVIRVERHDRGVCEQAVCARAI